MTFALLRALLVVSALTACNSPSTQAPDPGRRSGQEGANDDGHATRPNGTPSPSGPATPSALDIVLVSAIGDENPSESQAQKRFLQDLVAALAKKEASSDVRLAVIASQTAAISGVAFDPMSLSAFPLGRTRHVNFELAPKDALLGSLVLGCGVNESQLDSTHTAGSVTVCGQSVSVPPHSWTWASDDLKGRLVDFLRPGVARLYIFVSSSSTTIVTAEEFQSVSAAQNSGKGARVVAIVPVTREGFCTERNLAATELSNLVRSSSGKSLSYCRADWEPFIDEILDLL